MQRLHYEVKGMSCAACVAHVEKAVSGELSERDSCSVSLLTNSISILLEQPLNEKEQQALEERLFAAVKRGGYELVLGEHRTGEGQKDRDFRVRLLRLLLSAGFTLAVMYLSMGGMLGLPLPAFLSGTENGLRMALAQLLMTLPVLVLNRKFFINGFAALFHRAPTMDSLIAVGSGASVLYGLMAIVMLALTDDAEVVHSWLHDLYFESAAMILTLVSLGKLLESGAKGKASDAIRALSTLSPKTATVLRDGKETVLAVEEIQVGDVVRIRAGELVPVDGVVVSGSGSADESALTGESMPVEKAEGDVVRAACVLSSGAVSVRAEQVGENTSLSRIIRLLEDAAASKPKIARIADRVSAVFVPTVMLISAVTLLLWLLLTRNFERAIRSAIAVLVISCPCALGLATPTAITVGIGRGAKNGILFKRAEALEKLCSVQTAVFDKTGTVTEGNPTVTDLYAYGRTPEQVLRLAASVEALSAHPLALAVVRAASAQNSELLPVENFESVTGAGAVGSIDGKRLHIGKPDAQTRVAYGMDGSAPETSQALAEEEHFENEMCTRQSSKEHLRADFLGLEEQGKTAVLVTEDGEPIGVLGIADRIRSDAYAAVDALKKAGVRCLMLTGDNPRTAAFVAQKLNLDGYEASLSPSDKEAAVSRMSTQGSVCMVGDGINDAPSLARADVGVAIGAGTEIAIDCADVVLSGEALTGMANAYLLSRASMRIIKQNLFWALFYNAICIPVAAGLFYPLLQWQLSPMLASAAMSFSSVCVVCNALRLYRVPLLKHEKNQIQKENKNMIFKKEKEETVSHRIAVEGMMCQHCVAHVQKALESVKGARDVKVSLEDKCATVTAPADARKALVEAIREAGYTAE